MQPTNADTLDRRTGRARYFVPVCVRTPLGFIGGPGGYHEVPREELPDGPIIVVEVRGAGEAERLARI